MLENPDNQANAERNRAGWFSTTHWSMVLAAGDTDSPQVREALDKLCRTYWYPLYAYVRRKGHSAEDARDLTQEFFTCLLARNYLRVADRNKGRFRSFLLGSLEHFLAREWTKAPPKSAAVVRPFFLSMRSTRKIGISWNRRMR